jgi:hypothetical protein
LAGIRVVAQIASKAADASKTLFIHTPVIGRVDRFLLPIQSSENSQSVLKITAGLQPSFSGRHQVATVIFWTASGCNRHFLDGIRFAFVPRAARAKKVGASPTTLAEMSEPN